jgi:hypothetical protein
MRLHRSPITPNMRFIALALSMILALDLAACSMPAQISEAEIPPERYQDRDCDALNADSCPPLRKGVRLHDARSRVFWGAIIPPP